MNDNYDPMVIHADPVKDFFISMLTKDIELTRAILDLVDNSVDGATKMRKDESFAGLFIHLLLAKDKFTITDNCGGVDAKTARNYAFTFGRSDEAPPLDNSIGQFGVGMKRALFKIGKKFDIKSTSESSSFTISESTDEWLKRNEWEMSFDSLQEEENNDPDICGTEIIITQLHENISNSFNLGAFVNRMRQQVSDAHSLAMERGLEIKVNSHPVEFSDLRLLSSQYIKPVHRQAVIGEDSKSQVNIKIFAGLGDPVTQKAGWYIICNNRMLLSRDKSEVTGWGTEGGNTIPQ